MNAMTKTMQFILASGSPRRRELLTAAAYDFSVVVPAIPEPDEALGGLAPSQQAEALAYFKAREVADQCPDSVVLGADTLVSVGGRVLGKPGDRREAERMLRTLSGTRHQVVTGVAIIRPDGQRLIASDCTHVTMRRMTEEEIRAYLDSGEWEGKAGAYAIQETADRFVQRLEGSFSNVVGLPMELVEGMFEELNR